LWVIRAVPRAWACTVCPTDCTVSAIRCTARVTLLLPLACSTVARAMALTIRVLRLVEAVIFRSAPSASLPSSTPPSTWRTPHSPLDGAPALLHPFPRVAALLLTPGDQLGDLLGGRAGALRQLLDLLGHHGEALPVLPGLSGDDCRVEGKEVGLLGHLVDDVEDRHHLTHPPAQPLDDPRRLRAAVAQPV